MVADLFRFFGYTRGLVTSVRVDDMDATKLEGPNAVITVSGQGITIKNKLLGREKRIGWDEVAGATIRPGNLLTLPKLLVLTKFEQVAAKVGGRAFGRYAGREAMDWFVAVPKGKSAAFEAMKDMINSHVARIAAAWRKGQRVLVRWSDGQTYGGTIAALDADKALVVFPNGHQSWVEYQDLSQA